MPRIAAPTISENRDLRQTAILEAATTIAHNDGLAKITVGEVARLAGISRSSVYDYFDSAADIIAEVLVDELMEMCNRLAEGVAPASNPKELIELWVRTSMSLIADGRHQVLRSAAGLDLPPTRKAQINQLHRQMAVPLVDALASFGVTNPIRMAQQISAVADVAVRQIEAGGDPQLEIAAAERFVLAGVASL